MKADFTTVASVEVTGPNQVTLRLNQPDTALPLILADRAGMMSSPKAVQELGKDHNRKPVGTGPYTLVSWVDGDKIVLKRNDKYWRPGRPYLDGIEIQVITEIGTAVRSVLAGDNHYVYFMSPQQKPLVDRAKNLTVVIAATVYCLLIYFNYSRPPFNDVRIRKAINYAVNREDFVKLTLGGVAETATMLLPKTHWAYDKATLRDVPVRSRHGEEVARRGRIQGRDGHHARQLHRPDLSAAAGRPDRTDDQGRHQATLHQRHDHHRHVFRPSKRAMAFWRPGPAGPIRA